MMERSIANTLDGLRTDISAANIKGNVEGLLAQHIVGDDSRLQVQWCVYCDEAWLQNSYDPSSLPSVAALGYTITHQSSEKIIAALQEGMQRAMARDPSMAGHGAALHDPPVLIGLALAARALQSSMPQYLSWCSQVINGISSSAKLNLDPMTSYAASICGAIVDQPIFDLSSPLSYCAALNWWLDLEMNAGRTRITLDQRSELRETLLERTLTDTTGHQRAYQAALLWDSLTKAVNIETTDILKSPLTVAHALEQFESCLRRWRWDTDLKNPVRWPIRSEREVQDIVWMILRAIFLDLEDEDTLPKFGHSTYRADFGIPSIGLLIEIKFARSAADFKAIEKQVLEDVLPYLRSPERYREILVFIYDDSCSVQEHATTRLALSSVAGVSHVLIASRPSHLPSAAEKQKIEKCTKSHQK